MVKISSLSDQPIKEEAGIALRLNGIYRDSGFSLTKSCKPQFSGGKEEEMSVQGQKSYFLLR
jgi:hypothetical protein